MHCISININASMYISDARLKQCKYMIRIQFCERANINTTNILPNQSYLILNNLSLFPNTFPF